MIRLSKINDKEVKPIEVNNLDTDARKWKGRKLFTNNLCNVFLVAKKRSGKSNCIFNILKNCANKNTNILVFSSTCDKDSNYIAMKKYFKNKGMAFVCNTSIFDEDKNNILQDFLDNIKVENKEKDDESENNDDHLQKQDEELENAMFGRGNDEDEEEPRQRKSKYKAPEYIFVFDDLSNELKNKSIVQLLKQNRHYNSMVLLSSQYMNDLDPQSRRQLDYLILFRGHRLDKLELIYNDVDLSIDLDLFLKLYKHATEKQYNFLYVDIRNDEYRKNFNYKYLIEDK